MKFRRHGESHADLPWNPGSAVLIKHVPRGCLFHLPDPISSVSKGANNSFVGALVGVQQELIVCVLAHSQHTELNVSARPPPRIPTLANSAAFSTAWQLSVRSCFLRNEKLCAHTHSLLKLLSEHLLYTRRQAALWLCCPWSHSDLHFDTEHILPYIHGTFRKVPNPSSFL